MSEPYDSAPDTRAHIERVGVLLHVMMEHLRNRAHLHDASKLQEPEKSMFDEYTPRLRALTYGSDEYKTALKDMGVALAHHYAHNSHHPEHHTMGVGGMSLLDVLEMLCDWKAATERHANGDIRKSLEINQARFGISDQLAWVLENTVDEMGW